MFTIKAVSQYLFVHRRRRRVKGGGNCASPPNKMLMEEFRQISGNIQTNSGKFCIGKFECFVCLFVCFGVFLLVNYFCPVRLV